MVLETRLQLHGMTVEVRFRRHSRRFSAELRFGEDDRAVIDAASLDELEALVEAAASAAVLARRCGAPQAPALVAV